MLLHQVLLSRAFDRVYTTVIVVAQDELSFRSDQASARKILGSSGTGSYLSDALWYAVTGCYYGCMADLEGLSRQSVWPVQLNRCAMYVFLRLAGFNCVFRIRPVLCSFILQYESYDAVAQGLIPTASGVFKTTMANKSCQTKHHKQTMITQTMQ